MLRTVRTEVVVLLLVAAGATAQPTLQPPAPPLFRSTTQLVVQAVGVTDRDGHPVEGLTAADFVVTENGEPQEVAFVEFQRLAADSVPALPDRSEAPTVPPMTGRGGPDRERSPPQSDRLEVDTDPYRDRRLLVLYFDLSAMPSGDAWRAWEGAMTFLDQHMEPADLVSLVTYRSGVVRRQQDFTDDRVRLSGVIQRLINEESTGSDGFADLGPFGQNDAEFTLFQTDRQLSALQTAVGMFARYPQRTTLVYFGSHLQLTARHNQAQYRATVNAAIRANVSINPVDARGLVALPPLGDASVPSPSGVRLFSGAFAAGGLRRFERSQDALHALAADTGGRALTDHNDLSLGIVRAAQAVGNYYVVAWYSTHTEPDGRLRRVRITLAGDRDAELTYRRGYFGDKAYAAFTEADRERQLEEALMAEHAITDLSLGLTTHYFQLNGAEYFVPVFVTVPGRELAAERRRRGLRVTLDLLAEVRTGYGVTVQNLRDRLEIALSDEEARAVVIHPVQYETGFTLLPDDYAIRVVVRDATTGRIGTYETTFSVPNLDRETNQVPLSAVVLSGQQIVVGEELYRVEQETEQPAIDPLVDAGLKLVPSATGVFRQGRDLHVLAEAYQRSEGTSGNPLVAFVGLYRDNARTVETPPLVVPAAGSVRRPWAIPLRFTVPLDDTPPGRYDCQVSVLDPVGQQVAFWREPIVVTP